MLVSVLQEMKCSFSNLHSHKIMYNYPTCVEIFQEHPTGEEAVAPLGQQVLLSCSVGDDYHVEKWQIKRLNRDFNTDAPTNIVLLTGLGIIVTPISRYHSTLQINGTEENSGMEIYCEVAELADLLKATKSCIVDTLFFGKSRSSVPAEIQCKCKNFCSFPSGSNEVMGQ